MGFLSEATVQFDVVTVRVPRTARERQTAKAFLVWHALMRLVHVMDRVTLLADGGEEWPFGV